MKLRPDNLPNDIDSLKQLLLEQVSVIASQNEEIAQLKQSMQQLIEQFRLAQQKRFGASSESHEYQGELFNEAEVAVDDVDNEPEESTTDVPPKKCPKRQSLPKDLPREVIIE